MYLLIKFVISTQCNPLLKESTESIGNPETVGNHQGKASMVFSLRSGDYYKLARLRYVHLAANDAFWTKRFLALNMKQIWKIVKLPGAYR